MNRRLILPLLLLLAWAAPAPAQEGEPSRLTVARLFDPGEFHAEGFGPAKWREDASYTTVEPAEDGNGRDIVRYDPASGRRAVLVPAVRLTPEGRDEPLAIADYAWSPDGSKLLVFTNTRRVWRQNTRGDYWVLDLPTDRLRKLGGVAPEAALRFAKFAPDGRRVAYVWENNIYVERLDDGRVIALTRDGSRDRINGTFDWVYEEELDLRDGFRWSPDGRSVAYWQLDTSGMRDFTLIDNTTDFYPRLTAYRYPKVGQTNPACRIGVVDAEGGETRWMTVPGDPREHYIARMDWAAGSDAIVLQHLNRLQNTNEVMLADARTGQVRAILTEHDDAWVDVGDDLTWLEGGKSFAWTSERDGWRRLYLAPRSGGEARPITRGPFDVIDLVQVDDRSGWAYYLAAPENPTRTALYRVRLDGEGEPELLTPPAQGGTHEYRLSPDSRWAFHTYSAFGQPPTVELIRLPDHKVVRILQDNAALRAKLEALAKGPAEFFRVAIGDGVELDGWVIKPPDFDRSKRYPLLIHVYGEPAGQTVLDRWGGETYLWHRMLAQRGYVVASVDNRGTPAPRGRAWRKCIYRRVGILASRDQAAALRALEQRWPFLDRKRVGVWGWSGGGSMTLNALFRYPELYRAGIAIAFISDQRYYDTIYQERYMGLPQDNPGGYRDGSPITFADRLEGRLLLVHGTGDDNCHYQSCEALVNKLIEADKPFAMMAYPNRSHGIFEGKNTRRHLFELMTRFLDENLPSGPR